MWRMLWAVPVALAVAICVVLSQGPASGRPVVRATPPTATVTDTCTHPRHRTGSGRHPAVTVDAHPSGVRAVWYPGLNWKDCREAVTHAGAALAGRLATDIRRAKPYPDGAYACPADSGREAVLFFTYPHRSRAETVTVTLTGCAGITASGDRPTLRPGRVIHDLRALAPASMLPLQRIAPTR